MATLTGDPAGDAGIAVGIYAALREALGFIKGRKNNNGELVKVLREEGRETRLAIEKGAQSTGEHLVAIKDKLDHHGESLAVVKDRLVR